MDRKGRVLLGVTGGIAAYKAPMVVRELVKRGLEVRVAMTEAATRFVSPLALETVSGHKVYIDVFDTDAGVDHVDVARWADVMVIAPATANVLSKMAHGHSDDMVLTSYLAFDGQVVVAPGMNTRMWLHPATQHNVRILRDRGVSFVGPDSGELACGEVGPGRMAEPGAIADAVENALKKINDFNGLRVLITGGPTREHIDPVRFISNPSSGKTAIAMATQAARRGADVTLVLGPTSEEVPTLPNLKVVRVTSAQDMAEAVLGVLMDHDVLIMSAAVADWTVASPHGTKLKKEAMGPEMTLTLVRTPDILRKAATLRGSSPRPYLVGFAAETASGEELIRLAQDKLRRKGCDVILANDVSTGGFGTQDNHLWWVTNDEVEDLGHHSKQALVSAVLDRILDRLRNLTR